MPSAGVLRALVISGFLLTLPGGMLPLWGFHVRPDFDTAGNYFLSLAAGMGCAMFLGRRLSARWRAQGVLTAGCFFASVALLMLTVAAPPAQLWFQHLAMLITGSSAGLISAAVFASIGPVWEADPAGVSLRGGIYFSIGSVAGALLMTQCFDDAQINNWLPGGMNAVRLLAVTALVPMAAAIAFRRLPATVNHPQPEPDAPSHHRTVLALLFGLLLFVQFAVEWSIAGWLPIYLIDRLGMSPTAAVTLLVLYWTALLLGRAGVALLLKPIPHGVILASSAFCALFGGMALTWSDTRGGVVVGVILMGLGFSAIFPLASEQVAERFTSYRASYFSGLFALAMSGGVFAAFLLGHIAAFTGLRAIPVTAMLGSCAVIVLILMLRLGRKVSGN